MKIYTKTGDQGQTSLLGGERVSKAHDRINAYGTVDELNSQLGLLRDQDVNTARIQFLVEIQERLFTIGASLAAVPGKKNIVKPDLVPEDIAKLEQSIDAMDGSLPPMKNFILPGGHSAVSICHITRCVCRRAERLVILLSESEPVDELIVQYLNRLSDYLFVLGRKMAQELRIEEKPWKPREHKD